jgi:hypothetical protein
VCLAGHHDMTPETVSVTPAALPPLVWAHVRTLLAQSQAWEDAYALRRSNQTEGSRAD